MHDIGVYGGFLAIIGGAGRAVRNITASRTRKHIAAVRTRPEYYDLALSGLTVIPRYIEIEIEKRPPSGLGRQGMKL